MLRVVGHSWRQSLAAFTLAGVFGSAEAVARVEPPLAEVAVVGAIQETDGEKKPAEKPREEKATKAAESLYQLQLRLKQLEEENAKLREALGQQKKLKQDGEPNALFKKSPEKQHADDGKKGAESPDEVARKIKALQDEIAGLRKTAEAEISRKQGPVLESDAKIKEILEQFRKLQADGQPNEAVELELKLNEIRRKRTSALSEFLRAKANKESLEQAWKEMLGVEAFKDDAEKEAVPGEIGRLVRDLRQEVNRLRDEVAELRGMVKEQERTPKK